MRKIIYILFCLVLSQAALAHTTSTSYLNLSLNDKTISGEWQVNLGDIDLVLGLDSNNDLKLVWDEISNQKERIISEFINSIHIKNENTCQLTTTKLMVDRRATNTYLIIPFNSDCESKSTFSVNYNFLYEQDAFHKAILNIRNGELNNISILSYSDRSFHYDKADSSEFSHFLNFIIQGIIHVLIGLDHVLFVICLLISATLVTLHASSKHNSFRQLSNNTIKLVTTFTIAHSITLILASTKILSISPTIIEPVIALSVIVLALLNFYTRKNIRHWPIVFAFGLIHGFGFAFVLDEVDIQAEALTMGLFGFNLGVEFGQLIIVFLLLPLLYILSKKQFYLRYLIPSSSVLIALIGFIWLIERTNNVLSV